MFLKTKKFLKRIPDVNPFFILNLEIYGFGYRIEEKQT